MTLAPPGDSRQKEYSVGPLYTIGHSTRTFDELVRIFEAHGVRAIADVRRFPGSRRSPHFARQALQDSLPARGIAYLWIPGLGGHRRRAADAPPSYWRVAAFAAYADHLRSAEFRAGWDELCAALAERPTAIMCAEATPYRCHRRLISDWAELHGIEVVHLIDDRRSERHHLTAAARRAGDDVVYETSPQLDLGIGE
ncbi:MAG TPA: DUF488 domain-containing protein [Polyangia bacterium]|nr:DUF488 domain-containing protein [Polyangia bacterium]